ncbi:MAG: hypothetical protein ACRC6V_07025 [Bacteroidales bacterium]
MVAIPTAMLIIVCLLAATGCNDTLVPKSQVGNACYERGKEGRYLAEGLRPDNELYLILNKKVKDLKDENPGYDEFCKSQEYKGWSHAKTYIDKKNIT